MTNKTNNMRAKSPNRVTRDPNVMFGKPVIVDTRITVEQILRALASGDAVEDIIADYPPLTIEDIRAAQAYAADFIAGERLIAAE
jgi:uncharacterized protein (DUF433 family)